MIGTYYKYWGKAEKAEEGKPVRYHLLPYHCLDVAAVGWILSSPTMPLIKHLSEHLGMETEWLRRWFIFCLSLHDLGKFATAFQGIVPQLSSTLVPADPHLIYTERHDTLGFILWREVLRPNLVPQEFFSNGTECDDLPEILRGIDPWMEIVTGHHGEPPKRDPIRHENFFSLADEQAALNYLDSVTALFLRDFDCGLLADKEFRKRLKPVSWLIAGATVLADWLGSSRIPEEFCRREMPLDKYWHQHALPFASRVVNETEFTPSAVAPFLGIAHLFPFINSSTPLQQWAENRPLVGSNQLFILEDVTGAGKTEAALVLAHRLMAQGLADGMYVALPTMATANAMYERLGKAYRRMYTDPATPSLVLAHGARHLSEKFRSSVGIPETIGGEESYGNNEDTGEAYCNAWFADSRKKALLAEVGVGTLDQALLAILPARHQSLRLLGLARKVLLVDEVHAYDPYMNQLLQTLLEAHARQGGSVILLSATLPLEMRRKYVEAFCLGIGTAPPSLSPENPYPLVTHIPSAESIETSLPTRREVQREVSVSLVDDLGAVFLLLQKSVAGGKCVCWVRNTVKDARWAYDRLIEEEWMDCRKLSLFHSRFAMLDRQRIESDTLNVFGKNSTAEMRAGRVLVATQVVEQSLDLDFDVMISDLAPIDLLIQRVGRQHRHVRDAAGNPLTDPGAVDQRGMPVFYIYGPPPTPTPSETWLKEVLPGTQAVYAHVGQLWLTQQLLAAQDQRIKMPDDARILIEGVYGEEVQANIPDPLLGFTWDAEGEANGQRGMARLNALKLQKGYTRSSSEDVNGWARETRIPTRLGDETVSVALARLVGATLKPYALVDEFAWEMSMLALPKYEWQKAWDMVPSNLRSMIEQLKEEVRALKWVEVLPLTLELRQCYDSRMGWKLSKEEI